MNFIKEKMTNLKLLFNTLDWLSASFLGITLVDIVSMFSQNPEGFKWLDGIDGIIKMLMALAGLVYFILKGVHNNKMNKLERETKRIENKMKEEQLEGMEIDNEKKSKI